MSMIGEETHAERESRHEANCRREKWVEDAGQGKKRVCRGCGGCGEFQPSKDVIT